MVYTVPSFVALALSLVVIRRTTGRQRAVWLLLTATTVLGLGGDLVWAVQDLVLDREVAVPSIADGLWLVSYLPLPFALVHAFGRAPALRRARALLDTSLVAVAVGLVGWRLLIAPQVVTGLDAATAMSIAYVLADLVIVVILLSLGFAGHRHVPGWLGLLAASYLVSSVGSAAAPGCRCSPTTPSAAGRRSCGRHSWS